MKSMILHTIAKLASRVIIILPIVVFGATLTAVSPISIGHAAPAKMKSLETPLEATRVLRYRVNRGGSGRIVLTCFANGCSNDRIRLLITPETRIFVNNRLVNPARFSPRRRDLTSAFYLAGDGVLNRLFVKR
ncbi:MAG: hypothetical protein AAF402_06370 [Pseudomonadota bacterium]